MKINKQVELYDFTKEEANHFKNKSGVYALIYDNEVIYVGQSINLAKRLKAHMTTKPQTIVKKIIEENGKCNRCKSLAMYAFLDEHKDDIQFVVLLETDELNKYEEHYIKLFLPRYNYKGVDVPY